MRSLNYYHRFLAAVALPVLVLAFGMLAASASAGEAAATVEKRLTDSAAYLASDALEGRGVGTKGLDLAAEYLREQFSAAGLKVDLIESTPFQTFSLTTGSKLGATNELTFVGPAKEGSEPQTTKLELDKDFNPLAIGGTGQFQLPVVFVGYGITGRKEMYDDYENVDVKGKAVIVLRHEPQQKNPHSNFDGAEHSRHAFFNTKVSNAFQHGAAAVIFVTDATEIEDRVAAARKQWQEALDELVVKQTEWKKVENPTREELEAQRKESERLAKQIEVLGTSMQQEYDPVFKLHRAGEDAEGREIPVIHVRRGVIDPIIKSAAGGKDLETLETEIDGDPHKEGPKPQSFELKDWILRGQTDIHREKSDVKNVIAVLEGEGPLADETIIVGAHYDHLGYGGPGSAEPTSKEIHNGADDNASGTATLLEIARSLAAREKKLPRRVVFIAFTGEERGLLGSAHYARNPSFPLEKTVAMLNMDMVGRLQDNKLIVNGIDTAKEFEAWVDAANLVEGQPSFHLIKKTGGFGPSDHATFYGKNIPVLHLFTGNHKDYHKPSDDVDKLDVNGMRRVADLLAALTVKIAETSEKPTFQESKQTIADRGGNRPYFGSIPDFSSEIPGYALSGVAKDSPAQKAGIQGGDVVIKFGDSKIGNLEDIDGALRKYKAGDKAPVVIQRGAKQLTLEVTLDPPR